MRLPVVLLALFLSVQAFAQQDTSLPQAPYQKYPTIPPFDLLRIDSTHLTKNDIAKKQNTLIMFFSPDCSHCQHQTEDMIAAMDSLRDIQIVMATYQPFEEMVDFYQKYEVAKYPNIKMGRDTKFFLPPYYRMKNLPYMALYDKKGELITTFEGNQTIAKLVEAFNKK